MKTITLVLIMVMIGGSAYAAGCSCNLTGGDIIKTSYDGLDQQEMKITCGQADNPACNCTMALRGVSMHQLGGHVRLTCTGPNDVTGG